MNAMRYTFRVRDERSIRVFAHLFLFAMGLVPSIRLVRVFLVGTIGSGVSVSSEEYRPVGSAS